jgi:hypothetical protein
MEILVDKYSGTDTLSHLMVRYRLTQVLSCVGERTTIAQRLGQHQRTIPKFANLHP